MGWLIEDGREDAYEHEGHVVAVVRDEWRWRELRFGDEAQEVRHIQVACSCGWRSHRMTAPITTKWVPCIVLLPSEGPFAADMGESSYEDAAYDIWVQEHRSSVGTIGHLFDVRRDRAEPVGSR